MPIKSTNNPWNRRRFTGSEWVSGKFRSWHTSQLGDSASPSVTASGGVIGEYTDPTGNIWKSHTFNTTGTFVVSEAVGTNLYDYLAVGGGAGGGNDNGGGGGAGAVFFTPGAGTLSAQTYPVTVGAGGAVNETSGGIGANGSNTVFSTPTTALHTAPGGGGGAGDGNSPPAGAAGGSGGGGGMGSDATGIQAGPGTGASGHPGSADAASPPVGWGNDGGEGAPSSNGTGGGGGGAVTVGTHANPTTVGKGGTAAPYTISGGPGSIQYYGAGGGGGGTGGPGPGGPGGDPQTAASPTTPLGGGGRNPGGNISPYDGYQGSGSGGGGGYPSSGPGGSGGSGCFVIRYKIGTASGSAKASGGTITFSPTKTIHTFTGSGTFTNTSGGTLSCDYLIVAGGGAGSSDSGGGAGGGAGGVKYGIPTSPVALSVPSPSAYAVTVGAGGNIGAGPWTGSNRGFDSSIGAPSAITSPGGGGGGRQAAGDGDGESGCSSGGSINGNGSWPDNEPDSYTGHNGHPGGIDVASPTDGWGGDGGEASPGGTNQPGLCGAAGGGSGGDGQGASYGGPAGNGGPGTRYTISGDTVYYGGGGGGGARNSPIAGGEGGSGGGGDGVSTGNGNNGTTNTGGGGGAGRALGSLGGSGIVIIAYPT